MPQLVGRAPTCDIPIIDPTISRKHAELRCDDDGIQVRDLESINGTFVNGERIASCRVSAGDQLTFGHVEFTVEAVEAAPAHPAASRTCTRRRAPRFCASAP